MRGCFNDSVCPDFALACMYVCMYVCLGPPQVPSLTNLKKLNKTFNTERFPWGIGPSLGMMIYVLKHAYVLEDILACLDTSDIHTCSKVSDIHTHTHTHTLSDFRKAYIHACLKVSDIHTCIHAWKSLLKQASRSSKNQVSTRLSRMLQNTHRNYCLDTLFGPGRISGFLGFRSLQCRTAFARMLSMHELTTEY